MGSDVKRTHGAEGRTDLLYFDPEVLIVVDDMKHPLYDERVKLPLDERTISSIMAYGVLEPVVVRKNGETKAGKPIVEVIDGRQRVRCAREANKRLKKERREMVRVPAVLKRCEAAEMLGVMISANEIRTNDGPLVKARKMARYLALGKTEESAAVTFGCSLSTVRNHLALLDLHTDVQALIEEGKIGVTLARKLTAFPQEEQLDEINRILELASSPDAPIEVVQTAAEAAQTTLSHVPLDVGSAVGANGHSYKTRSDDAPPPPKLSKEELLEKARGVRGKIRERSVKNKAQINAFRDQLLESRSETAQAAVAALGWVLGIDGALDEFRVLSERAERAENDGE